MTTKSMMKTLSNRLVRKLTVEKDTVFWDRDLTGFGVRVYPTGSKVYVAQARGPEGPRRVTVGRCANPPSGWRRASPKTCCRKTLWNTSRL